MSLWEYKVITSGKGGFARPDLMEKFLNDLGRDEWEIVQFHAQPDNFLVFTGLARRSTQRDWTLQDAAAAAAKAEAEKLRAEFEAKFKAASSSAPAVEERAPSFLEEKVSPDDGFRKPVDTSHDDDPEEVEEEKDEWDKLTAAEEDELPTFFEAIKPHLRRNQRGPGMSVGVDYLAKKWEQTEDDLKEALVECGFVMPEDEDSKAEYLEYDGDLFWLNINRRGELWINTKEKPRPVFRPVKAARVEIETPAPKADKPSTPEPPKSDDNGPSPEERASGERASESPEVSPPEQSTTRSPKSDAPRAGLPEGAALLDKIRPHMRRNRRGPGGSGSTTFLSRALRTNESALKSAFVGLGLTVPETPADKPSYLEIGNEIWWLNVDSRGGLWINGREKKPGETAAETAAGGELPALPPLESAPGAAAPDAVPAPEIVPSVAVAPGAPADAPAVSLAESTPVESTPANGDASAPERTPEVASVPTDSVLSHPMLAAVRLLLKETRAGAVTGKVDRLAEELGRSPEDLLAALIGTGMKAPEKPREKPVFVEHAGEILWLNRNAKGELWLNAKASKFSDEKESEDDEEESEDENAGTGEADGEKKPARRGRARPKKTEGEGSRAGS